MARGNHVTVKGDITSDIYYDVFTQGEKSVPFLRVYLMVNGGPDAREVKGLRVVFYGYLAEVAEAHLQCGSRIHVEGHIQMRRTPGGSIAFEVVAEDVEFLRNATWERGKKRLAELAASGRSRPEIQTLLAEFSDELVGAP